MEVEVHTTIVAKPSSSAVYNWCDDYDGDYVALKKINLKDNMIEGVPAALIREVSLLKEMRHDNVIRLFQVLGTEKNVELVFEFPGSNNLQGSDNLRMYLRKEVLGRDTVKIFLHQILDGLAYCHSLNFIHRDLRPENIHIDKKRKIVKLADFGWSKTVGIPCDVYNGGYRILPYMAPEILHGNLRYSCAADVWAVGCIFAEMVKNWNLFPAFTEFHTDFLAMHQLKIIFSILGPPNQGTWPRWDEFCRQNRYVPENHPKDLSKLVPRLDEAGIDLLTQMLRIDPSQRITAHQALQHPYFNDLKKP